MSSTGNKFYTIFVLTSVYIGIFEAKEDDHNCHTNPYVHFSTKTSYFAIDKTEKGIVPKGCSAKKIWILARHGTRNPSDDDILDMKNRGPVLRKEILDLNEEGKGGVCPSDVRGFEDWVFNLKEEDDNLLTQSGREEFINLAKDYRREFENILNGSYEHSQFIFRHTKKQRTRESALSFAKGLFPNARNFSMQKPLDRDPLLQYSSFCPKWIKEVEDNPNSLNEQQAFYFGSKMTTVLSNVRNHIGSSTWTMKDIELAYDICRYDRARNPRKISVWCTLFTIADLEVLEYLEDLKYWYTDGYWNTITREMACPLMIDILDSFSQKQKSSGRFLFGHSSTVLPFLSFLGLYNDDVAPTNTNYDAMGNRNWKTSKIGSFASNIAFILINCSKKRTAKKQILVVHQGKRIALPMCSDEPCSYKEFKSIYKDEFPCQFNKICKNGTDRHQGSYIFRFLIILYAILYIKH